MRLTCETDFLYAYRPQRTRLITKDALRYPRAVFRVHRKSQRNFAAVVLCGSVLLIGSIGLSEERERMAPDTGNLPTTRQPANLATTYPELRTAFSYRIALSPHAGTGRLDRDIQATQRRVKEASDPRPPLERLGWLYVTKARTSHDQGFYKLAEQCALALEIADPKSPAALLLRGHMLISFHHFAEAEAIARELVKQRTLPFDYGLLGDALVEQGRLAEAVSAYQRMVDLRPDLQSYSRVAYMRWLKGDLEGAVEVARLAARAGSPLDSESASWALTRLGLYYFQAGLLADAKAACDAALTYSADYPAALLLQSRFLLIDDRAAEATTMIQGAAAISPLPEFQWALADTLRSAGRAEEAAKVEAALKSTGAQSDPRTLALFLATRGDQPELAVDLARRELESRADIFTHDALAWALAAAGRLNEAWPHMEKALAEGTIDARLFTHAGVIEAKRGHTTNAGSWLSKASSLQRMLLPSEQQQLAATLNTLTTQREIGTISARENQIAVASYTDNNKDKKDE
jgi:tetratricopeptide (TPR) repeat protein